VDPILWTLSIAHLVQTAHAAIAVAKRGVLYGLMVCVCGTSMLNGLYVGRGEGSVKVVLARLWHVSELRTREPSMWSGVVVLGNRFLWTLTRLLLCWRLRRPQRFHKLHTLSRSLTYAPLFVSSC
jgi:hypothetical protein